MRILYIILHSVSLCSKEKSCLDWS